MQNLESVTQKTIVSMLRILYPNLVINLSLNGISLNGLSAQQKAQLIKDCKNQGMEVGIPDLLLYLPKEKILNLELKTDTGAQSPAQKEMQHKLNALGHNYYIIRNYQTVFSLIAQFTEYDFRVHAYRELKIPLEKGVLTKQFLHYPPNTSISIIEEDLKKLYCI